MLQTTNYELNIVEGTDKFNPLTVDNPNYETIDETMKDIQDMAIPTATELKAGTVHAINRSLPDSAMFRFTAASNYSSGDTFTVDGTQVTALLSNGQPLGTDAYVINAEVLCCLVGTRLTMFIESGTIAVAEDSDRLGGELPNFYASAADLGTVRNTADSAAALATANQNSIQTINSDLAVHTTNVSISYGDTPTFVLKKTGNVAMLRVADFKNMPNSQLLNLGTIPAGYRPANTMDFALVNPLSSVTIRISILSTGAITAYKYEGTTTGNCNIRDTLVWIIG